MKKFLICICTYKRYEKLSELLKSINNINLKEEFNAEILIVDNYGDSRIEDLVKRNKILTKYYYEENIGIVNARNRCLTEVKKLEFDYLIFLDDDEKVEKNWLVKYYECLNKYEADVICGPVITEYKDLNNFISKSKIYTREILDTGTEITTCGCGNVLIKKAVIDLNIKFNIRYNTSGGEDTEYFKRIYELGKKIIYCKDAIVYEELSSERATLKYLAKRSFVSGRNYIKIYSKNNLFTNIIEILKSILKLLVCTICIIFFNFVNIEKSIKLFSVLFKNAGRIYGILFSNNLKMY